MVGDNCNDDFCVGDDYDGVGNGDGGDDDVDGDVACYGDGDDVCRYNNRDSRRYRGRIDSVGCVDFCDIRSNDEARRVTGRLLATGGLFRRGTVLSAAAARADP